MLDLRGFVENAARIVERHRLDRPGEYRRWLWQDASGSRDLGLNPYGCADAVNILYTTGRLPRDAGERLSFVETLQALQDARTGLFREATHDPIHTTAHCVAALELLDAGPLRPLAALRRYTNASEMVRFIDGLDWRGDPWRESHKGAGLYAALVLTDEVALDWQDRYFEWLSGEVDPRTGFLRRGCVPPVSGGGDKPIFHHLAGTFHYLFNFEYARRAMPHGDAMADSCLEILERNAGPFIEGVGFSEIDLVYCLTRSARRSGHRCIDVRHVLHSFAGQYVKFLTRLDPATDDGLNDLHALFGALCALAELQQALPGEIRTEKPLRLVLDRRPFI